jgi:plastocyanin
MSYRWLLLVALAPLPLFGAEQPPLATGTITGTVRFTGKVPPAKKVTTTDGAVIEHNDLVVEPKSKGLRYVFVLVEGAPVQPKVKKAEPVVVDQRDMLFVPRVVAVRHGQAVRFDNSDLCNHSVQAVSTLAANQFNKFTAPNNPLEHVFEVQKKPVVIGCALHGWMRAWVYVVPHSWFAVTDAEGRFRLNNVPAGKHTLSFVHPDSGLQERKDITVEKGQTATISVEWTKLAEK